LSNFIGLNDVFVLEEWVRLQTKSAGLRVRFEPGGKVPRTTKDEMIIPQFNPSMTEDDVLNLRGHVIHECAHHMHGKEIFDRGKRWSYVTPKTSPDLFSLFNMVEDSRINRVQAMRFRGDAIHLSASDRLATEALSRVLVERMTEHKMKSLDEAPEPIKKLLPCLSTCVRSQQDWNVGLNIGAEPMIQKVEEAVEAGGVFNKLNTLGYQARIRGLRDTDAAFQCALDLFRDAGYGDPDKELEQAKQKAQAKQGEGKSAEEGGQQGQGVTGNNPGEGQAAGQGQGGEGDEDPLINEDENKLGDPTDYLWTNHQQKSFGWGAGSGSAMSYVSQPDANAAWVPQRPNSVEIINYTSHKLGMRNERIESINPRWKVSGWSVDKMSSSTANKIRRLLQVRSQAEYNAGYKSGSLHKKAVYRVAMPTSGDGEAQKKIFRRREEKDILDCAVSLVVDASGSMDGHKYIHASVAAALMCNVFDRALRIPCEIHTFSTGGKLGQNVFGLIKDFAGKITNQQLKDRFGSFARYMSGNGDPDAIMFAYRRLLGRHEKRKVCIVLSDGSPSYAVDGSPGRGIVSLVREMEKRGIEVYGVGLCSRDVARYYPKHIVIDDADELEGKILELLARIVTKNIASKETK
jgi:Mg-chelatase subunit ChlD